MIPKIIHCVWLSGEEKPKTYLQCLDSWKRFMPTYTITEWSIKNLPQEVLQHSFVSSAIKEKKWAYATDYIRLWVLYHFGGIYLDLDVLVFKPFDLFLQHQAFSALEYYPEVYIEDIRKKRKNCYGTNIEAAVIGAQKGHPWIKRIMDCYEGLSFINDEKFCFEFIMPRIMSKASIEFGFKYMPLYQVLDNDVHIYPPDVFSSCSNKQLKQFINISGKSEQTKAEQFQQLSWINIRYAIHLCNHGWYSFQNNSFFFRFKKILLRMLGVETVSPVKKKIRKIVTGKSHYVHYKS